MREVRFSLGPDHGGPPLNSYAGSPAASGVSAYLVLQAVLAGTPDARTGYLVNITVIDRLLRERSIPLIRAMCERGDTEGDTIIAAVAADLEARAPAGTRWVAWSLKLTPFLIYTASAGANSMLQLTQSFEFSAAHRLHCPSMSDEDNRSYFGKCNNPNGHGHNYVVDVSVAGRTVDASGGLLTISQFERIVKERVIDRFDHKHLNEDCPEFRDVNPSVENIARVIWDLLEDHVAPARLSRVRVWETPKTYAEYDGK